MLLEPCTDQKSEAMDEFYGKISRGDHPVDGKAMVALIARLRGLSDRRRVWGLTSHYHLCLLAKDTYQSPWYVKAFALDDKNYSIDYLMPAVLAPWSSARVSGEARSEDEAVAMIITAMERSGGWS